MLTTAELEQISTAQKTTHIPAFDLGAAEREVSRLQAVYATKRAEMEAFERLIAETSPDFILRGPSGQKLVLRLAFGGGTVEAAIREGLESTLCRLEAEIVEARLYAQDAAQKAVAYDGDEFRPAILALCQPAATAVAEQPSTPPLVTAAQLQATTTLPLDAAA